MGWLGTQKTLCLFEVDLKGPIAPACMARVAAVVYPRLDAAAWAAQRYTSHFPDRHLFPARFARGEQFWTAQHEGKILSYCWATHEPVEIGVCGQSLRHGTPSFSTPGDRSSRARKKEMSA